MVLYTERRGPVTLTVEQEYPRSGLHWKVHCERGVLPEWTRESGGKFYPDSHGERIHGATMDEVIATCAAAGRTFLKWE